VNRDKCFQFLFQAAFVRRSSRVPICSSKLFNIFFKCCISLVLLVKLVFVWLLHSICGSVEMLFGYSQMSVFGMSDLCERSIFFETVMSMCVFFFLQLFIDHTSLVIHRMGFVTKDTLNIIRSLFSMWLVCRHLCIWQISVWGGNDSWCAPTFDSLHMDQ
jgi:hypothetical protein